MSQEKSFEVQTNQAFPKISDQIADYHSTEISSIKKTRKYRSKQRHILPIIDKPSGGS